MPQEILSVAVWEPVPQMEAASLRTLRELSAIVASKGYGRDLLYRDRESHYVFLRYWKSEDAQLDCFPSRKIVLARDNKLDAGAALRVMR